MMDDAELGYLGAAELGVLYRSKDLSPVEVTEAILQRIERVDPGVNAMIRLTKDHARAAARRSEAAFRSGDAPRLLEGVPVTIKDLQHTKGIRTDFGSHVIGRHHPGCGCALRDAAA